MQQLYVIEYVSRNDSKKKEISAVSFFPLLVYCAIFHNVKIISESVILLVKYYVSCYIRYLLELERYKILTEEVKKILRSLSQSINCDLSLHKELWN